MQGQTEFAHTKTIESPGFKIRVYRPVLTEEEHKRRMRQIHKAAEMLLKETKGRTT